MIVATFCLSLVGDGPTINIVGAMIFWRIILGFGIGGGYPSSSVISSEFAAKGWRGAMMTAVFSCQGLGQYTAALVSLLCTIGFRSSLHNTVQCTSDSGCIAALDKSWRLLYAYGIIPAFIALYFRFTIPESAYYTRIVLRDETRAKADAQWFLGGGIGSAPRAEGDTGKDSKWSEINFLNLKIKFRDFWRYFEDWEKGKALLGTAASWFLLDVAFVRSTQSFD
jgi:MFS transporter, PHS family, inorganic phosphate transporter